MDNNITRRLEDGYRSKIDTLRNMVTGVSEPIPYKGDALVELDRVSLIGENYYFIDRTSNGRNFLITGYDFPTGWTSGFPYKSAATISAPAEDATLIAVDTTNFWYDSEGTPNQIPVISLFQNVDYLNVIFCKHSEQIVDGNGVETYEPRVSKIVIYESARIGSQLSRCNTYFSVPAKLTTNIREVGTGKTYETIGAAITAASDGDTIYVYTGDYNESIVHNKAVTTICLGNVEIIGATSPVLNISKGSIYGAIINGNSLNNCIVSGAGSGITTHGEKLYCKNSASYNMDGSNRAGTIEYKYCIFNDTVKTGGVITLIDSCFFKNAASYQLWLKADTRTFNIRRNKFYTATNYANIFLENGGTYNVLNNTSAGCLIQTAASYSGTITATYNIVNLKNNLNGFNLVNGTYAITLNYNTIRQTVAGVSSVAINILNQVQPVIKSNIITVTSGTGIVIDATTVDCGAATVENNRITNSGTNPCIMIGNETVGSGDNYLTGTIITKNIIIGNPGASPTQHGVFITRNNGVIVSYNYLQTMALGILFKGTGEDLSGVCMYNTLYNCTFALLSKGAKNIKYYNNTLYVDADRSALYYFLQLMANDVAGDGSESNDFQNNILVDVSGTANYQLMYIVDAASELNTIIDNNIIYSANNANKISGEGNGSFAAWQAAGFDANSQFTNPNLTTGLWPATPITIGENLPGYTTGLDITTNWGSSTQVPVIITKENTNNQIGAYIQ